MGKDFKAGGGAGGKPFNRGGPGGSFNKGPGGSFNKGPGGFAGKGAPRGGRPMGRGIKTVVTKHRFEGVFVC